MLAVVFFLPLSLTELADAQEDSGNREVLEMAGKAFLETEIKTYLEQFLNQRPPVEGMEGFGSQTMFVVQLLISADAFLKSDNDKQRFVAIRSGAAAYVGYAYAATPAVGLAATAVVLAVQIIEANVAASYAQAMLAIYREILQIQLRINDLNIRLGEAEALRFLVIVGEFGRVVEDLQMVDKELRMECGQRAGDFNKLSICLTKLTRSLTLRQEQITAIDRLLVAPDPMLALLGLGKKSEEGLNSGNGQEDPHFDPASTKEEMEERAKATREYLLKGREGAKRQLDQLQVAYAKFVLSYQKLAVSYIFDDALGEAQRIAAIEEIRHRCMLDHSTIANSATTLIIRIERIQSVMRGGGAKARIVNEAREAGLQAEAVLSNYNQRQVSCPSIKKDAVLKKLMGLLESRFLVLNDK